ncbi:glutaredoxin [Olsenella sp. YH-ols2217]|uniref:Glutaredoxin n=1 Tax=Kribbibacterium absianum TaxID=3044210 RepID=A0ABT6ZKM4_9ACTN|nr:MULTISPECIES: glutaredoxin [unclassified Olsenella]MDJ1122811.1 glutaredoxin [Olsenella sp. YH-ols2216]MDJ1129206.1 glutaredoxin [Olsenella sp. YH-ols2217]
MTLFYLPTCPHCHKVITWIEGHGITDKFNYVDVSASDEAATELEQVSGQDSVPCLQLGDGTCLVGDTPIIEWLEKTYQ